MDHHLGAGWDAIVTDLFETKADVVGLGLLCPVYVGEGHHMPNLEIVPSVPNDRSLLAVVALEHS